MHRALIDLVLLFHDVKLVLHLIKDLPWRFLWVDSATDVGHLVVQLQREGHAARDEGRVVDAHPD